MDPRRRSGQPQTAADASGTLALTPTGRDLRASLQRDLDYLATGAERRWLGVEFRHLGALAAVAREGSFRRAAESLGYVQSAISGQIAHLERAVGTQLVERSSGSAGATLTPAGDVLLEHVETILARFEAARIDVRAMVEGAEAAVRVAVIDGVGPRRIPAILREFARAFPDAEVTVDDERPDEDDFARLAHGELDLMITELPLADGPFDCALLERDPYVVLARSDSLLASYKTVGVEQLAPVQLLIPAPGRGADAVAISLRDAGIDQPPWLRPHGTAAVQALVGAGLGAGIVPSLAVDPDDGATVIVPVSVALPERSLVLVRHREREDAPATIAFMEIVHRLFSES
jgi:DNA-binding transcriptional LysR family regulator